MLNRTSPTVEQLGGEAATPNRETLRRRFPTIESLRQRAQQRVPRFGFDFVDGAANDEDCARRNLLGLRGGRACPPLLHGYRNISTDVELFGRRYSAPLGVAPMGSAGLMWPGRGHLPRARGAAPARAFVLATPANASIERIAEIAPDVFWFQLYRFPQDDNAITFDLVKRADGRAPMCSMPTIDSAGKSKRPRDIKNSAKASFRFGPQIPLQVAASPAMGDGAVKNGMLRAENIVPYTDGPGDATYAARTMQVRARGSHHIGRAGAAARPLEARLRRQGRAASRGRGRAGVARRRRLDRVESRRPPF